MKWDSDSDSLSLSPRLSHWLSLSSEIIDWEWEVEMTIENSINLTCIKQYIANLPSRQHNPCCPAEASRVKYNVVMMRATVKYKQMPLSKRQTSKSR